MGNLRKRVAALCWVLAPLLSFSTSEAVTFQKIENTCHYDEVLKMDVWTSYAPPFAIKEFKSLIKEKYNKNIDVHVLRALSPDEFYDRVRSGVSDIISPSHNFMKDERTQFIDKKLIIPVDRTLTPNLNGIYPLYINNDFVTSDGKLYGVPLAAGGYSLLYNKDHFKKAPTSWNVLWDDKYKGRYSLSKDYYEANIYVTALALGYKGAQIHDINLINTVKFKLKLKHLLENANYWEGAPKDADLKNSVLTLAWGLSHSVTKDSAKKWKLALLDEGVSFWTDYLSVTRNVERNPFIKTVAMEWLNYVVGKRFQEKVIIEEKKYLSPLKISSDSRVASFQNKNEVTYLVNKSIYWPILTIRDRNGLKSVYDQVLEEIAANKKAH
ncbi:extracellular solute-binding protein [Bdellovibrio sp. HCB337]|uniref:extracellular solute-binding protein n=1 Tax=Bdellovibrio sp. HCB337 TaxID=3394358 RepID=UPI0039A4864E